MKKMLVVLAIVVCSIAGIALAQTAQQSQVLKNRITLDNIQINSDETFINRMVGQLNRMETNINAQIATKQAEIVTLNTEVQSAEQFLNGVNATNSAS
jgi:hypothetical protein